MNNMLKQEDLRFIRKSYDASQSQFAELIHCTLRMYQYYESMQKKMPTALLELLEFKLKEVIDNE